MQLNNMLDLYNSMNASIVEANLVRGKQLKIIKENKLYKQYASHIKNWIDFLKDLNISYSEAEFLIEFYGMFIGYTTDVEHIPIKRLNSIVYMRKYIEDLDEVINMALHLPEKDWKDELNKLEGYQSYLSCNHSDFEEWIRCKECKRWVKKE